MSSCCLALHTPAWTIVRGTWPQGTAVARGLSAPSDPTTQPGSAQLGSGGVHSAVAPTLWQLGPSAQPQGRPAPEAAAMPGM